MPERGEPFDDGEFFDDGFGWLEGRPVRKVVIRVGRASLEWLLGLIGQVFGDIEITIEIKDDEPQP